MCVGNGNPVSLTPQAGSINWSPEKDGKSKGNRGYKLRRSSHPLKVESVSSLMLQREHASQTSVSRSSPSWKGVPTIQAGT